MTKERDAIREKYARAVEACKAAVDYGWKEKYLPPGYVRLDRFYAQCKAVVAKANKETPHA